MTRHYNISTNPIAVLLALAAFAAAPLASAAPVAPTATAKMCPAGAAIAQRTSVASDGTITITTRCVAVAK
jgi:hypothetical protein